MIILHQVPIASVCHMMTAADVGALPHEDYDNENP
jgi:hypothetical protein